MVIELPSFNDAFLRSLIASEFSSAFELIRSSIKLSFPSSINSPSPLIAIMSYLPAGISPGIS